MQWEKTVSNHISETWFIYIKYKKLLQVNSKIIMIWLENGQMWKCYLLNRVWLFATPWTAAHQAPLCMEFSRLEYWSGLPFASPGDLPNPGIEPRSPELQADSLPSEPPREETPSTHLKNPHYNLLKTLSPNKEAFWGTRAQHFNIRVFRIQFNP